MNIERFGVEEWMDKYESDAKYNITDTCARPMTLKELFALAGEDREDFVEALFEKEQSYGSIYGLASLKEEIAGLYETITPDDILTQHGATGGNQHVLFSLVRPGDRVVAFSPSYQQFYSTPRALGANVTVLKLRRSNGFLPDLDELRKAAARGLRLICINNPNNPTGSLIPEDMMKEIVEIARSSGTYILCDEVYAGVSIEGAACPSIADLYEKGIATGSMSKAFSLAGLRLGWLATKSQEALRQFKRVRDYDLVSCGLFDEETAALALRHKEKSLKGTALSSAKTFPSSMHGSRRSRALPTSGREPARWRLSTMTLTSTPTFSVRECLRKPAHSLSRAPALRKEEPSASATAMMEKP